MGKGVRIIGQDYVCSNFIKETLGNNACGEVKEIGSRRRN